MRVDLGIINQPELTTHLQRYVSVEDVIEVQDAATLTCTNESQEVVARWLNSDSSLGRGPISK